MKINNLPCCLLAIGLLFAGMSAQAGESRRILSSGLTEDSSGALIVDAATWHPYPRASERGPWEALPQKVRSAYLQQAKQFQGIPWPTPTATEFLEFVRTGDRSGYQAVSFGRRERLAMLVLAECMEARGRFIDDVVDGIWTICEESYWGVPAHLSLQRRGPGLPDVTEPTVDLFAAETASLLSWTWYLLGDELQRVSPLIGERITYEVQRRVLSVNLQREDFWWMGFGQWTNNWNPWICSNWLASVLILEEDSVRRARSVYKILRVLDNFLDLYGDDGGCDEGPGYWNRAGGSLFDCLELLSLASAGRIDHFDHPLIGEMGRYIYRSHIAGPWSINFADAPAKPGIESPMVYRYGRCIGDSTMMHYASFLAVQQELGQGIIDGNFGVLGRVLPAMFTLEDLSGTTPEEPMLRDVWLGDLQVMAARPHGGSTGGLYLAVKGGHNAESHNHNDVGNFLIYRDGQPVIIDVGVGVYTAKTFSSERYSIWTMQSAFHNLPTVNGQMQHEGRTYAARGVQYHADEEMASLSLDLAGAYPAAAKLAQWVRTLTLERRGAVTLAERYRFEGDGAQFQLSFMAAHKPLLLREGLIRIPVTADSASESLDMEYDGRVFQAEIEEIALDDPRLQASWGNSLFRILLTPMATPREGEHRIAFR